MVPNCAKHLIYTTMMFIIDECNTHEIKPVVTFHQPLLLKSMIIKTKEDLPITICQGTFILR